MTATTATTLAATLNSKASVTDGMHVYNKISSWIICHLKAVAEEYSESATSVRIVARGLGDKEVHGIGFTIKNGSGDEEFTISFPYIVLGLPKDIYTKVYSNEGFLNENAVLMLSLIGDVMRLSSAHDRTLSWTFEPNGVSRGIESALSSVTTTSNPNPTITNQNTTITPDKFKGSATDKQIKFANAIASRLNLKDELNKLSKTKADYGKFIGDHIGEFRSKSGKTEKL